MDPEHVAIALDLFATEDWVREQTGQCNLARTVCHLLAGDRDGPLALPGQVAEAYLDDPETLPIHGCEYIKRITGRKEFEPRLNYPSRLF